MEITNNNMLTQLLDNWQKSNTETDFYAVITELTTGNSSLHVPSRINSGQMVISSIYEDRGSKLLLVYSKADSISELNDQNLSLLKMDAKDVLNFCEENNIPKIVINPQLPNEFILEKPSGNVQQLKEDVTVQIGRLRDNLPHSFLTKLITNFREAKDINEVYIYSQKMGEEISTVLGVVLSDVSQKSIETANLAFKNALAGEQLSHPNMMMIIETDDMLQSVKNIQGALFYTKSV